MHRSFPRAHGNLRVFYACLLSFMTLMAPLASVAAASPNYRATLPKTTASDATTTSKTSSVEKTVESLDAQEASLFLPAAPSALPVSLASNSISSRFASVSAGVAAVSFFLPAAGDVTATMSDALLPGDNLNGDANVDPGEKITYTATLSNPAGGGSATGLSFNVPIDSHTTLDGPVQSTPVAFDQTVAPFNEDSGAQNITLMGQDPDGSDLTFSIVTAPPVANGSLGTIGAVTCTNGVCSATVAYTPAANFFGPDSFTFRVNDGTSNSNEVGTVSITVNSVNDAPSFTNPGAGQPPAVNEDVAGQTINGFITGISPGPANESSQLVDFVIDSNSHTALFAVQPAISPTGTLTYTPAANANGSALITYHLHDNGGTANGGTNVSSPNQTFTITVNAVNDAPVAQNKAFTVQSNMKISGLTGLLVGVTDPDATNGAADPLSADAAAGYTAVNVSLTSITANTCTNSTSTITSNATGTFNFDPPPGLRMGATCVLQYTVTDTGNPGNAVSVAKDITITAQGPAIWFVQPGRATNGNGTLSDTGAVAGAPGPFNSLASAKAKLDDLTANQRVFVYKGTGLTAVGDTLALAGSSTQAAAHWLIGEGAIATNFDTLMGISPPANTIARPTISTTANGAANRPTIQGTVSMKDNTVVQGVNVNVTTTQGLRSVSPIGAGSVMTIKDVNVTSTTGAAVDFNNAQTISYTSSDSVLSPNILSSTTGIGLNVVNTTIGASGLNFRSISVDGNDSLPSSGIVLNNTGNLGGLTVTGFDGADAGSAFDPGSGGTIQDASGNGVSLTTTEKVSLSFMNITSNLGSGIGGSGINGFQLDNASITSNGDNAASDESGINVTNLTGTASAGARPTSITNSTIQNNWEFQIQITNSSGTLTDLTMSGNIISTTAASGISANLFNFLGNTTASMKLTLTSGTFTGNWTPASPVPGPATISGTGLSAATQGSGGHTVNVSGATFTNNNAGVDCSTTNVASTFSCNVSNNNFQGTRAIAINSFHNGNAPFNRTFNGTFSNNIIGTAGNANSASFNGRGIDVSNEGAITTANYTITGNTIQEVGTLGTAGAEGIGVNVGLGGQATGGGATNVTITGNTIGNIRNSRGLIVSDNQVTNIASPPGAGPFPTICANISGNTFSGTIAGQAGNGQFMRIKEGFGTVNVTQATPTVANTATELDNANNFTDPTKISISGTPQFSQPACTASTAMLNIDKNREDLAEIKAIFENVNNDSLFSMLSDNGSIFESIWLKGFASSATNSRSLAPTEAGVNLFTEKLTALRKQEAGSRQQSEANRNQQMSSGELKIATTSHFGKAEGSQSLYVIKDISAEASVRTEGDTSVPAAGIAGLADSISRKDIRLNHAPKRRAPKSNDITATDNAVVQNAANNVAMQPVMAPLFPVGTFPVNGTGTGFSLPPGKTTTITFKVTVNNPPNFSSPTTNQVSHQGTLSGAFQNNPLLTDDLSVAPGTTPPFDPNVTDVDLFNTTNTLTSSPTTPASGQAVTYTATVAFDGTTAPPSPAAGTDPSGTVSFFDNGSLTAITGCANVPVTGPSGNRTAQCNVAAIGPGPHSVVAKYSGDGNFDPSDSAALVQSVAQSSTSTAVTSSLNPSLVTQDVTFTATVTTTTSPAPTMTGTVTFKDGGTDIVCDSGVAFNGSTATCVTNDLTDGNHNITAVYSGDTNFITSTGTLTGDPQVVNKSATTTTLASGQNPSSPGNVTFTATVASQTSVVGPPDGTVDFINNTAATTVCDDVPLVAGQAQCVINLPTDGTFNIQATYNGSNTFATSNSNVVAQVISTCTANIVVANTNESGAGSLRQAISDVCEGGTITFDPALTSGGPVTISLNAGEELAVTKSVTITGPGSSLLTVERDGAAATKFRIFNISAGKTVNISGMTIANGRAKDGANGTLGALGGNGNAGAAQGPAATGANGAQGNPGDPGVVGGAGTVGGNGENGGGILNNGTLQLTGVVLSNNFAGNGGIGGQGGQGGNGGQGGMGQNGGAAALPADPNTNGGKGGTGGQAGQGGPGAAGGVGGLGGGIYNAAGATLTLIETTLSGNQTGTGGPGGSGGLAGSPGPGGAGGLAGTGGTAAGTPGVTGDAGATNTAGGNGAVGNGGSGGGIYNVGTSVTIQRSTLNGNKAFGATSGGGINSQSGTLIIKNSTLSGNTTNGSGGGLFNAGTSTATLTAVTITLNHANNDDDLTGDGGGIAHSSSNPLKLENTIVAGNYKGSGVLVTSDVFGAVDGSSTFNLIGLDTGMTGISNGPGNNQVGSGTAIDPVLGPLANNGGPTSTHALGNSSPATDTGDDFSVAATTDQRGFPRPINDAAAADGAGDLSDIGAFERQATPAPPGPPDLDQASDSGGPGFDADDKTNQTTNLSFTITPVIPGATVELFRDGVSVASGIAVSTSIQLVDPGPLTFDADGTVYSYTAKQSLGTGNTSNASTALPVTITIVPNPPDLDAASDTGGSSIDNITNDTSPTFTITNVVVGATVELLRDGTPIGGSGTGVAAGTSIQLTDPSVSTGTYNYTARQTFNAITSVASTGLSVQITITPSAPDLITTSDTGTSSTDDYTSDTTPTFEIAGVVSGATVDLFRDGTVLPVATGVAGGSTIQLTDTPGPGPGTFTYRARQTIGLTVSPISDPLTITIDNTVAAAIPDLTSDSGVSATDNVTNATSRTFDILSTEANSQVELLRGGVQVAVLTANLNTAGGTVTLTDAALIADNTYQYSTRITDKAGNVATSADLGVTLDKTAPTVAMTSTATNPTATSPIPVTATFSEAVYGFLATDITVANATSPVTNFVGPDGNSVYTFDLTPIAQGPVSADIAASVATDLAGNNNAAAVQFNRTFDTSAPTANITPVVPDPRNSAVSSIQIVFSKPVTGFNLADLTLKRGTLQVETATVVVPTTITTAGNAKVVVTALGMANSPKTVLVPVALGDTANDVAGKMRTALGLDPDVSAFFIVSGATDKIVLTAKLPEADDATMNIATDNDTSVGITAAPLSTNTTAGAATANLLTVAQTLTSSDNITWTLGNLGGATGTAGTYGLKLTASGSGIVDSANNPLAKDAIEAWVMDTTPPGVAVSAVVPTVTGPTATTVVHFTAVFTEPVTGFDPSDVAITGTSGATLATITQTAPFDGTTYDVGISGMTQSGSVTIQILANGAFDAAGNGNTISGFATVTFNADNSTSFEVNTTEDSDDLACTPLGGGGADCTLREAINAANADFGAETITFNIPPADPGCPGGVCTISLLTVLPDLSSSMTIQGTGAKLLTVQRSSGAATDFRIFRILAAGSNDVTIDGLTVSSGNPTISGGGGILNSSTGTVTISNATISGNAAIGAGGGMLHDGTGTLNITNSTISGNSSQGGGGLRLVGGTAVNVTNSTISGNASTGNGGGIEASSPLTITHTTITNNQADSDNNASGTGGGINASGTVTLRNTIVARNLNGNEKQVETATVAGAITAAGAGNAKVVVTAIGMGNTPKTVLVPVANNDSASTVAGKMRTALNADPDVSGFFAVSGAGANIVLTALTARATDPNLNIETNNDTSTGLTHTQLSANTTAGATSDDISGTIAAASSFNLIGDAATAGGLTNGVNDNQVGVTDPGLFPLADNGGQTLTHALQCVSPAIDKGSAFSIFNDQRGGTRPLDLADTVYPNASNPGGPAADGSDIGAFEVQTGGGCLPVAVPPAVDPTVTNEDTAVVITLTGTYSQNTPLTFTITDQPDNGSSLTPSAANCNFTTFMTCTSTVTYTPNANYHGPDAFKFIVSAGGLNSDPADVNITVTEVNDPPVATNDALTPVIMNSGQRAIPFADLLGNDSPGPADESGQTLTVFSVGSPTGGTVVLDTPNSQVLFTPANNFFGIASFNYTPRDNGTPAANSVAPGIASFTVIAPPTIQKNFSDTTVDMNVETVSLTFKVTNPNNGTTLNGVGFVDNLPGGLEVATPSGLSGSCGGGTITAADGSTSITLAGATLGALVECTFSVNIRGTSIGLKTNVTDAVTSTEGGSGGTATASVTVLAPDMTITKTHSGSFDQGQTETYTITVSNSGNADTTAPVTVTDTVPVGLTPTGPNGAHNGWTCNINGQTVTCTRSDVLTPGTSYPAISLTVEVANPAPLNVTNTATVSGGGEQTTNNNSASDMTSINCLTDFSLNNTNPLMISRFRMNGPAGPQDEFVEIFNPSTTAHTVASGNCAGGGYGVFASSGNGTTSNAAPLVCFIPNGTVIPAGGYYLCTGATYSLSNLGRNGGAEGATSISDAPIGCNGLCSPGIPDDAGLALMNVAQGIALTPDGGFLGGVPEAGFILYDKVGFAPYGAGAPSPLYPSLAGNFCEGAACLQPVGDAGNGGACDNPTELFPVFPAPGGACYGEAGQYEFLRRQTAFNPALGTVHIDTNNNANDFILVAPNPGFSMGLSVTGITNVTAILGSAAPQGSIAPPDTPSVSLKQGTFDSGTGQFGAPNAERNYALDPTVLDPANNPEGTFALRLRFTNNSASNIAGLRFRIDQISTLCGAQTGTPAVGSGSARNLAAAPDCGAGSLTAILKLLNSAQEVVIDNTSTAYAVLGTVIEDLSASATPTPPGAGPLSPRGGGLDGSFIVNPSSDLASVGDGVTGGTGVFATAISTTDPNKVIRIKIKFGVVKSGRFILLITPAAKPAP